jgi:hypothetical protein
VETQNNDATTRAQKTRRGNVRGCVDKSRGGLFDIVKNDGGTRMDHDGNIVVSVIRKTHEERENPEQISRV